MTQRIAEVSLVVQTAESQFPSQQKQIDLGWFDEATYRTRLELAGLPADAAAAVAAKTAATRRESVVAETALVTHSITHNSDSID